MKKVKFKLSKELKEQLNENELVDIRGGLKSAIEVNVNCGSATCNTYCTAKK